MKRKLEDSELPPPKRKATLNAISCSAPQQNSEDVNAIEYLDILLKLKGRLEGILRTNEMTNVPIEDSQVTTNLEEELEESHHLVAEEISADEWSEEEEEERETEEDEEEKSDSDES